MIMRTKKEATSEPFLRPESDQPVDYSMDYSRPPEKGRREKTRDFYWRVQQDLNLRPRDYELVSAPLSTSPPATNFICYLQTLFFTYRLYFLTTDV